MAAKALTANRLNDGAVVYLSAEGVWVRSIASAVVVEGEEMAGQLMSEGDRAVAQGAVVAPYLIEIEPGPDGIRPKRYRERLRAFGPSVPVGDATAG